MIKELSNPLSRLSDAAMAVVEFFLPRICHVCLGRIALGDEVICDACRSDLLAVPGPICPKCGAGRAKIEEGEERCRECPKAVWFDGARGAVGYSPTARAMIHELKFQGHVELAPVMARRCFQAIEDEWAFEEFDAIVPVPLHETRWRERGFNQAEEIGRELERLTKIPMNLDALERIRPTRQQSTLHHKDRPGNVRDAFYCDRAAGERNAAACVRDRRLLLLDDVITSCATVNECARALKEAGARRVMVLVFARA
ncbi:MAG: ComF family protein [Candidatus Sumerlaeota bacterium]|nr:ComF family protein [Candidatus Sumerlaeota bacterium]